MVCENEHEAESALKDELEELGLWAKHLDTNVDGFPDLLVAGKNIILVEMKYDKSPAKEKTLHQLMESSQPVLIYNLQKAGYYKTLLCIYRKGQFKLYGTAGILNAAMACRNAKSLRLLAEGEASQVAMFIKEWCDE